MSRAAVIRGMDRAWIETLGLPSAVLMEHAGRICAERLIARFGERPVVVLCGPGNNGGDGYVIARHLAAMPGRTDPVVVVPVYPPASPDAIIHHRVASGLGLLGGMDALGAVDAARLLIVDAIFGTGQRAPLALPALDGLDEALRAGATLIAIDVPTGVDGDTGTRIGAFPEPALTLTVGREKPFLFRSAMAYELCDIGLELAAQRVATQPASWPPEALLVLDHAVAGFTAADHKWSRGHVAVVAGSAEKAGAGVLACLGALGAGAGLVTLHTPREGWGRLGALPPEVMVEALELDGDTFRPGPLARADALVVGPGLGRSVDGPLRRLWVDEPRPVVFDADALRAIIGLPASDYPRLLTPHAGEAGALLAEDWRRLEADRLLTARRLAQLGPTIYKGACPIVTGDPLRILPGGVPALGTGGSGDVLAGIAGALLARLAAGGGKMDAAQVERAALDAAWLHQEAGRRVGGPGARASDIAAAVPTVPRA